MDNLISELVTIVEEIKHDVIAIYLKEKNKMDAELKLKLKRIQDIRLVMGWIQSNMTNWSCADCIYTVLSHSIIPFIESPKYALMLAEFNGEFIESELTDSPRKIGENDFPNVLPASFQTREVVNGNKILNDVKDKVVKKVRITGGLKHTI